MRGRDTRLCFRLCFRTQGAGLRAAARAIRCVVLHRHMSYMPASDALRIGSFARSRACGRLLKQSLDWRATKTSLRAVIWALRQTVSGARVCLWQWAKFWWPGGFFPFPGIRYNCGRSSTLTRGARRSSVSPVFKHSTSANLGEVRCVRPPFLSVCLWGRFLRLGDRF